MKVKFNGKYSFFLTCFSHFIVLDLIWKILEIIILGEVRESLLDSIMLILICNYIAWILGEES
jgi:hypothetical protein|nr:MAG TPA: hypothetical protein [Caudoviricetes sp.]DAN18822.1 MAG TPA: hypothetical protein [Caudoviricetes sp.]